MDDKQELSAESRITALQKESITLVKYARQFAAKQINVIQLMTFYSLGAWIVEVQQNGEQRAQYGKQVIS